MKSIFHFLFGEKCQLDNDQMADNDLHLFFWQRCTPHRLKPIQWLIPHDMHMLENSHDFHILAKYSQKNHMKDALNWYFKKI